MDDDRRTLRLDRINKKGLQVAQRLSDLLGGKDVSLAELMPLYGPDVEAWTKEARLRAFLDQINHARRRLLGGSYGRCGSCEQPFDAATLDEEPWIAQCPRCRAMQAPLSIA